MSPEVECGREMFVEIPCEQKRTLAEPMAQLEVHDADEEAWRAVEDGHERVKIGYSL